MDESATYAQLKELVGKSKSIKIAVAFWGHPAHQEIGLLERKESIELICNLKMGVKNGTIRFRCVEQPDPDASDYSDKMLKHWYAELTPHSRGDNITKIAPIEYDPQATCPTFDMAIRKFLPIEPVRNFVQRFHGYALTGLIGEQCFVFSYGTGANWKSTFIEILAGVMGPYCATINFESLSGDQQRTGSQASPDLARLPGARLVRASEPERGVQFKESLIKSLTGG